MIACLALAQNIVCFAHVFTSPCERAANIRKQQFEIGEVRTAAKQKLQDQSLSPERRSEIIEEYRLEAVRRQEKLMKYIRESGIHHNLQTQH